MNINPFIDLIASVISLYKWALGIWIILSWLTMFNIINQYQPIVQRVNYFLHRLIEPVLAVIRRYVPTLGGLDLSALILFLLLNFIQSSLYTYFYQFNTVLR